MTEEIKKQAEAMFRTGHYPSLMLALAIAMQRNVVWQVKDSGEPLTLTDMFKLAKTYDEEHPLDEGDFYMVSIEGAIGLSPGLEYMTDWIFTPMPRGEERDRLVALTLEELKHQQEEDEAPEEPKHKEAMNETPSARFCISCGKPLVAGDRFCRNCGTPIA